ncbi:hypothetical protein BCR42DRAFT_398771 [Absidia repens]|uniref:Uncharacterized protein n=1 Tax=Absidia repens TaxID=90262 RepID=A0A1X2HX32_9FUNG|nr:hypothetical protein BCR42DRAFT_398771 [Absidia repens]
MLLLLCFFAFLYYVFFYHSPQVNWVIGRISTVARLYCCDPDALCLMLFALPGWLLHNVANWVMLDLLGLASGFSFEPLHPSVECFSNEARCQKLHKLDSSPVCNSNSDSSRFVTLRSVRMKSVSLAPMAAPVPILSVVTLAPAYAHPAPTVPAAFRGVSCSVQTEPVAPVSPSLSVPPVVAPSMPSVPSVPEPVVAPAHAALPEPVVLDVPDVPPSVPEMGPFAVATLPVVPLPDNSAFDAVEACAPATADAVIIASHLAGMAAVDGIVASRPCRSVYGKANAYIKPSRRRSHATTARPSDRFSVGRQGPQPHQYKKRCIAEMRSRALNSAEAVDEDEGMGSPCPESNDATLGCGSVLVGVKQPCSWSRCHITGPINSHSVEFCAAARATLFKCWSTIMRRHFVFFKVQKRQMVWSPIFGLVDDAADCMMEVVDEMDVEDVVVSPMVVDGGVFPAQAQLVPLFPPVATFVPAVSVPVSAPVTDPVFGCMPAPVAMDICIPSEAASVPDPRVATAPKPAPLALNRYATVPVADGKENKDSASSVSSDTTPVDAPSVASASRRAPLALNRYVTVPVADGKENKDSASSVSSDATPVDAPSVAPASRRAPLASLPAEEVDQRKLPSNIASSAQASSTSVTAACPEPALDLSKAIDEANSLLDLMIHSLRPTGVRDFIATRKGGGVSGTQKAFTMAFCLENREASLSSIKRCDGGLAWLLSWDSSMDLSFGCIFFGGGSVVFPLICHGDDSVAPPFLGLLLALVRDCCLPCDMDVGRTCFCSGIVGVGVLPFFVLVVGLGVGLFFGPCVVLSFPGLVVLGSSGPCCDGLALGLVVVSSFPALVWFFGPCCALGSVWAFPSPWCPPSFSGVGDVWVLFFGGTNPQVVIQFAWGSYRFFLCCPGLPSLTPMVWLGQSLFKANILKLLYGILAFQYVLMMSRSQREAGFSSSICLREILLTPFWKMSLVAGLLVLNRFMSISLWFAGCVSESGPTGKSFAHMDLIELMLCVKFFSGISLVCLWYLSGPSLVGPCWLVGDLVDMTSRKKRTKIWVRHGTQRARMLKGPPLLGTSGLAALDIFWKGLSDNMVVLVFAGGSLGSFYLFIGSFPHGGYQNVIGSYQIIQVLRWPLPEQGSPTSTAGGVISLYTGVFFLAGQVAFWTICKNPSLPLPYGANLVVSIPICFGSCGPLFFARLGQLSLCMVIKSFVMDLLTPSSVDLSTHLVAFKDFFFGWAICFPLGLCKNYSLLPLLRYQSAFATFIKYRISWFYFATHLVSTSIAISWLTLEQMFMLGTIIPTGISVMATRGPTMDWNYFVYYTLWRRPPCNFSIVIFWKLLSLLGTITSTSSAAMATRGSTADIIHGSFGGISTSIDTFLSRLRWGMSLFLAPWYQGQEIELLKTLALLYENKMRNVFHCIAAMDKKNIGDATAALILLLYMLWAKYMCHNLDLPSYTDISEEIKRCGDLDWMRFLGLLAQPWKWLVQIDGWTSGYSCLTPQGIFPLEIWHGNIFYTCYSHFTHFVATTPATLISGAFPTTLSQTFIQSNWQQLASNENLVRCYYYYGYFGLQSCMVHVFLWFMWWIFLLSSRPLQSTPLSIIWRIILYQADLYNLLLSALYGGSSFIKQTSTCYSYECYGGFSFYQADIYMLSLLSIQYDMIDPTLIKQTLTCYSSRHPLLTIVGRSGPFAFFLGIAESNAFSAYKVFHQHGASMKHNSFKSKLADSILALVLDQESLQEQMSASRMKTRAMDYHRSVPLEKKLRLEKTFAEFAEIAKE